MNVYFDTFNRTNGAPGTSDSGHVYGTVDGFAACAIVSNALGNSAAATVISTWDAGLREFDCTVTLGTILAKSARFCFVGSSDFQSALYLDIVGSATVGSITLGSTTAGVDATRTAATGLNVGDAGTVRIVATKRNVKVYNNTTAVPVIDFDIVVYPDYTAMAFLLPTTAQAGTINGVTLAAISQVIYASSSLIPRVRTLIDEPDSANSYVSDDEIVYFLNLGQLDMVTRFPLAPLAFTVAGSVFDDNKEWTLPNDVLIIEHLHINQSEIDPIPYTPYDDGRYKPRGYYVRGNKLGIPNIQTGDSVKIWGRGNLNELTSTSSPNLPAVFTMPLLEYAVALCKDKDQDEQGSSFWMNRYEKDVAKANRVSAQSQFGLRSIQKVC